MQFVNDSETAVNQGKSGMLFVLFAKLFFSSTLSSFLNSLSFLGFIAIEFGIQISYPGFSMVFFGELLELVNFDLLSNFEIFEVPYKA